MPSVVFLLLCHAKCRQAASLLGSPSGANTIPAKRRHCWARQAVWLLDFVAA